MSTLLDAVAKTLSAVDVQVGIDGVGSAIRHISQLQRDPGSIRMEQQPVVYDAVAPSLAGSIPSSMQSMVVNTTEIALRTAINIGKPTKANALVDISANAFMSNVGMSAYTNLNVQLKINAPKLGATLSKINRVVNLVTPLITKGLSQAAVSVRTKFGTARISAGDFGRYADTVVDHVTDNFNSAGIMAQDATEYVSSLSPAYEGAYTMGIPSSDVVGTDLGQLDPMEIDGPPESAAMEIDGPPESAAIDETTDSRHMEPEPLDGDESGKETSAGSSNADLIHKSKKVYLQSAYSANENRIVLFKTQPKISVTESVVYDTLQPIHAPIGFISFNTSQLKKIQISEIKLISRTSEEATANLKDLHQLRGWTKPYFGLTGESSGGTKESAVQAGSYAAKLLGAPPDILYLYAYSSDSAAEQNFRKMPVVLESMSYDYPNDVDYIPTLSGIPFPVVMTISVNLLETHSPEEAERFSLADYRNGKMAQW